MSKVLRYEDAIRLAGGKERELQDKWEKVTRGLKLGASVTIPNVLGWLASASEFVELSGGLIRRLSERRSGLSRYSRTQRLEAAHSIVVVTSYFEALGSALDEFSMDYPSFKLKDLQLTKEEQVAIATVRTRVEELTTVQGIERTEEESGDRESGATDPKHWTDQDAGAADPSPAPLWSLSPQGSPVGHASRSSPKNNKRDEPRTAETARKTAALGARLVDRVLSLGTSLPEPHVSHDELILHLTEYYKDLSSRVILFMEGLAVYERLGERAQRLLAVTLSQKVPTAALQHYDELFARLATECPEIAFWSNLQEHRATRSDVRCIGAALSRLERILNDQLIGSDPDRRRDALARAHRAALDEPVLEPGDSPADLHMPTLGQAYMPPRFRVTELSAGDNPSDESWWESVPVRDDIEGFMAAYLTLPRATRAPLLVLGQPGSGKTVFTRTLAAALPAPDYFAARVVLRDTWRTDDIQAQIELAIRRDTGLSGDWPDLVASAESALPVVLLDGFDELLQVTGVSQSDYLERVADFQRREANQNRPLVVIVTSRTGVANRARPPDGTLAIRLEPLDDGQIARWLQMWNETNGGALLVRQLSELPLEVVLRHRELAGQPLLLLMLAIYDSDSNALQRTERSLNRYELYERMVSRFAEWQALKLEPHLSEVELREAVDRELRRLGVAAFAMHNRGAQWVTEESLDSDLIALLEGPAPGTSRSHRPLNSSTIAIGRFYFVHRATVGIDDSSRSTYEFLHATFGEFLVARLTWLALCDFASREGARTIHDAKRPLSDDLLYALLSFAPLSSRTQTLNFLCEAVLQASVDERERLATLLKRAFMVVHEVRPSRALGGYEPVHLPVPARYACYSANLALLVVHVAAETCVSELVPYAPQEDVVLAWRSQALLWRSQLKLEDWNSVVDAVAVDRVWHSGRRDLRLYPTNGTFQPPVPDLYWSFNISPDDPARTRPGGIPENRNRLIRNANFLCDADEDKLVRRYSGDR